MFLEYSWLIPTILFIVLPLVVILEAKKTYVGAILSIVAAIISTILSIGGLLEVLEGEPYATTLTWVTYKNVELNFGIYADKLSMFMAFIVSFIGTLIMIYSLEYMSHDREHNPLAWPRYFFEMTLFIAFMLTLVLSYSLLQLLVAWEGVGLCSYLLIGYWWWKPEASKAAKKAFITTRLGDIGLYVAVIYAYLSAHTLDIPKLNEMAATGGITGTALSIIALAAFWGAIGKSAQIPLFTWLPWAMEGPTTVSALIHAATMVKAGVFLVARLYPIYENAAPILGVQPLIVVAYIGGLTAAFAGILAVINNDIKGVLAYSTISHLGLLMLALGVGAYSAALLHLLNHAFFKAELFLVSGCVLHATHDIRNLHKLGGLRNKMKITWLLALLGALAISGIFPLAGGFWSKDEVLAGVSATGDVALFILGFVAAIVGSLYIFRWFFLIFSGKPKSDEAEHAHEVPLVMTIPVAILAGGAILWGIPLFLEGAWVPAGIAFVEKVVGASHEVAVHAMAAGGEVVSHIMIAVLTLSIGWAGFGLMLLLYHLGKADFSKYSFLMKIQGLFQEATFIDKLYDKMVYYVFPMGIARGVSWFDRNVVDRFFEGFYNVGAVVSDFMANILDVKVVDRFYESLGPALKRVGSVFSRVQTGRVMDYMALFAVGLILLLGVFVGYQLGLFSIAFLLSG